jgi:hydroxymethylpyrimidine pyrophosphatase-like HAD family hydrolase
MLFLFDIDGVLTDTGADIAPAFKEWFINWRDTWNHKYVLVTGSTYERTVEQIGSDITENALFVANCMGNSITQEGRSVTVNEFEFTQEEKEFLQGKLDTSPYPDRAGTHIAVRPGSVNFSIVGRDATEIQRQQYKHFDSVEQERLAIAKEFKQQFPRFDVFIGGDISIDICLRGANKRQIVDLALPIMNTMNEMVFFGDKMGEWGIDQPLADALDKFQLGRTFHITKGWQQTQHILSHEVER